MVDELEENATLPSDERRQHDRSRLIVDVFFDGKDATGVASTQDISLGGLYMNTQMVLPEGSLLMLRIPLGDEQVVVNAEVVYSNPGRGVGVQFQGLSEKDRALMERELPPL
jgi:Tfp pilus assembly protein PilZ